MIDDPKTAKQYYQLFESVQATNLVLVDRLKKARDALSLATTRFKLIANVEETNIALCIELAKSTLLELETLIGVVDPEPIAYVKKEETFR